jgi:hypothetical protein
MKIGLREAHNLLKDDYRLKKVAKYEKSGLIITESELLKLAKARIEKHADYVKNKKGW